MLTVPKKQLYLVLPFMGKMSALVKYGLIRSLHKRLPFCKVKIIFSLKDVVPEPPRFCQIYNFTCWNCNALYVGKNSWKSGSQNTKEHHHEHLKGILSTYVRDHMPDCNHVVAWDDFKVLGREEFLYEKR